MLLVNEIARFLKVHPNFQDKMEMWSWFLYVGRYPQKHHNDLYILNKTCSKYFKVMNQQSLKNNLRYEG